MDYEFLLETPLVFKIVGDVIYPLKAILKREGEENPLEIYIQWNDWPEKPRFTLSVVNQKEKIDERRVQHTFIEIRHFDERDEFPNVWSIPFLFELRTIFWVGLLGPKFEFD